MLEQKLLEEINRHKSINRNANKHYIMEQEEVPMPPAPADAAADMAPALPPADSSVPPAPDAAAAPGTIEEPESSTEEVDVTDLVNMTKNIKNDLENTKGESGTVIQKMDDVFSRLGELEQKLSQMDSILVKIDQLGNQIENIKEPTPVEKLEMRSLDSYPFNEKPQDFFAHKQGEMRASGKNEYVLTKSDVENYSKDEIEKTFNPLDNESQY
jgi:hypothetical protein